jgi:hypothetical protein
MVSVMGIAGADFLFEVTYVDRSCRRSNAPITVIGVIEAYRSTDPPYAAPSTRSAFEKPWVESGGLVAGSMIAT